MDPVPELLVEGLTFPESGRWHEGRLWFSDIDEGRVKAIDAAGRCETVVEAPGFISGLGWAPNGDLWIVGATEHKLFRWDGSRLDQFTDLSGLRQLLYNDMAVSVEGNAYIGTISFDFLSEAEPKPAPLVLVRPDGSACVAAEGLDFPNGMVITPDGKTLICGETYGARYTAFDIEEDGSLANRRVWAEVPGERPDGCCLDAEGGAGSLRLGLADSSVFSKRERSRTESPCTIPTPMPVCLAARTGRPSLSCALIPMNALRPPNSKAARSSQSAWRCQGQDCLEGT